MGLNGPKTVIGDTPGGLQNHFMETQNHRTRDQHYSIVKSTDQPLPEESVRYKTIDSAGLPTNSSLYIHTISLPLPLSLYNNIVIVFAAEVLYVYQRCLESQLHYFSRKDYQLNRKRINPIYFLYLSL